MSKKLKSFIIYCVGVKRNEIQQIQWTRSFLETDDQKGSRIFMSLIIQIWYCCTSDFLSSNFLGNQTVGESKKCTAKQATEGKHPSGMSCLKTPSLFCLNYEDTPLRTRGDPEGSEQSNTCTSLKKR